MQMAPMMLTLIRFVSNAAKLQEFNNDYNILLNVVTMHETSYIEHILPAWIDYHQHLLTNQVRNQVKYHFSVTLRLKGVQILEC